jgi:decaprenyl-phosphate phosphoribosyltransferase
LGLPSVLSRMLAAHGSALSDDPPRPVYQTVGRPVAPQLSPPRHRQRLRAALVTARPRQWIKNALVIAAAGAAGALGHDDVPVRVLVACGAFCLLASGIYCLNDVRDAAEDRLHPRKRSRPVAAGELTALEATTLGIALIATGLATCLVIAPLLLVVGVGYLAVTVSYTWIWRRILYLDVVAIAGGFVLRAVAGGAAAPVELSRWFVLVVTFSALFLAASKRYAERVRADASGAARRRVLERYSLRRLRVLLSVSGVGANVAYWFWAFGMPTVGGIPWRPLTAIPFCLTFLRYAHIVRVGGGEAPEEALVGDWVLLACAASWLILFALSVRVAT